MRIKISFRVQEGSKFVFPVNYNSIIQGFIYNNLSKKMADFIHNKGYQYDKRSFKMFTFSRLWGNYRYLRDIKSLIFNDSFSLYISSCDQKFIEDLAQNLIKIDSVNLNNYEFNTFSIEVFKTPDFRKSKFKIRMLSPCTVYQTLYTVDNKKKTYFYSPTEDEFSELILDNLKRKFKAFYNLNPGNRRISIKPLRHNKFDHKVINYKGFLINAHYGIFEISGNDDLIKLGYDTGIGSKNSQGFGMFEILNGGNTHEKC